VQFTDRDFFKQKFTEVELRQLLRGQSPKAVFNFGSVTFKKSGIDPAGLSDEDLMRMLVQEPRYFRRPIAVIDGKLIVGTNAKKLGQELGFEVA
jgi:arsenate reductase-like glutaredoxin family protein